MDLISFGLSLVARILLFDDKIYCKQLRKFDYNDRNPTKKQ